MDVESLARIELADAAGETRPLASYFDDRPAVLAFLRHYGWLLCREHAAQLRDAYDAIRAKGAEVVAIGTGGAAATKDFVERERIPYPVLADGEGAAATAASIESVGPLKLFRPASYSGAARAWRAGHRIGVSGPRVTQLGATFVVGPGPNVRYAHRDAHTADHAPLAEILAALD